MKNRNPRKKKALGQHFLRKQSVVDHMIERVKITPETSILEIGCGDGFLTRSILEQTPCKKLLVYEIDSEWAEFVKSHISDKRLDLKLKNVLDVDLGALEGEKPWVMLANLPYQVTFPILFLIQRYKNLFEEGVVMVQEEVAQKLVAKRGKPYSATTIFLQYHFELELMERVEPEAFSPPPKVFSRLIYFKPKQVCDSPEVPGDKEEFWKFVKLCFKFPRQILSNNLRSTHYDYEKIAPETLKLRAQQMTLQDFIELWKLLSNNL
jgi:16S rRNA (adenine1518-N6/adenine1519-N6)-dimethyltransferase